MSVHLYPTGLQLTEKKLKRNADLNISSVNKSKYNKAQVLQYPDKQQLRFPSSTSDESIPLFCPTYRTQESSQMWPA